ncbi:MAG: hypothetical protein JXK07_11885 [Spirochaetes bacterium]|nr:hypothetical protein [Spirochaetota bacterium]MBN2769400.1 hypothetical protein [Spirochaetota bacterium]
MHYLLSRLTCFMLSIIILTGLAACGGSSSKKDSDLTNDESEESVQIMEDAAGLGEFPEDAEVTETEYLEVNGEEVTGTENTRVDNVDDTNGDTSVRIPGELSSRALKEVVAFGIWYNGTMHQTAESESFQDLLVSIQNIDFGVVSLDEYLQDSTEKIDIIKLPLVFKPYDNYLCFYWKDNSGKEYRTPVVAIYYDPLSIDLDL